MLEYCKKTLHGITDGTRSFGHWHYTYLYYSQVIYRQGPKEWGPFRDKLYDKIVGEQNEDGVLGWQHWAHLRDCLQPDHAAVGQRICAHLPAIGLTA